MAGFINHQLHLSRFLVNSVAHGDTRLHGGTRRTCATWGWGWGSELANLLLFVSRDRRRFKRLLGGWVGQSYVCAAVAT
jgi:hypothetical protein